MSVANEVYALAARHCGLKVGDYVRLVRKAEDGESGWSNVWPELADAWVGEVLRIAAIFSNGDVRCIWREGQPDEDWFHFPYFVLKKVKRRNMKKPASFNPGDIVRVTRRARSNKNGWRHSWVDDMDEWIGKTCRVVGDNGSAGIRCEKLDGSDFWHFPPFVLEKVSDAKTTPLKSEFVPFETRVLVRDTNDAAWRPAIYGYTAKKDLFSFCVVGGIVWAQCIPYEGNEHLLGKIDAPQS